MKHWSSILALFLLILVVPLVGCQRGEKEGKKAVQPVQKVAAPEDMVLIPAGEFIMGSNDVDKEGLQQRFGMTKIPYMNEHPERKVHLDDYYIDKYEVSNDKYKEFIDATGHKPPVYWVKGNYAPLPDKQPVVMVSWFDADAYCKWRGKRLPTEAEWEKAARGTDGRQYPWGNEFDQKKTNALGLHGQPTPVGQFPEDVSPFGVFDVAGNVSEWVQEWYKAYPGSQYLDEAFGETNKVVRGGSWGGIGHYSFDFYYRSSFRNYVRPEFTLNDVGFRCARDGK
ncbi:MAG: formylglycine-generating enzyme family protein [Thermodesulfobacteriota bacterium]